MKRITPTTSKPGFEPLFEEVVLLEPELLVETGDIVDEWDEVVDIVVVVEAGTLTVK